MISNVLAILGLLTTPILWLLSMRMPKRPHRIAVVLLGATALTTLLIWATILAADLEIAWALRRFKQGAVYVWDLDMMTASELRAYHRWHGEDLSNLFSMIYAPLSASLWTVLWNGLLLIGSIIFGRWSPYHRNMAGQSFATYRRTA